MIEIKENGLFVLNTKSTTYAFSVSATGHLNHLYYGTKIHITTPYHMTKRHSFGQGNMISYSAEHPELTLEDCPLEFSTKGKGDIRESFIEIVNPNGSRSSDFLFKCYKTEKGRRILDGLPCSYGSEEDVETLRIELEDEFNKQTLELEYCVYEKTDVITRSAKLTNNSEDSIRLLKLMSLQLDLPADDKKFITFHGTWAREMDKFEQKLLPGKVVNESTTGTSSNRANPFVIISEDKTTEEQGSCYGINLVYSGNHYEACEVNAFNACRFVTGINPEGFEYVLPSRESFQTPEAVMTFSKKGFGQMSQNMHSFVRNHIVRGEWQYKERPILVNSWEAAYFNINEGRLLKLAKSAKDIGIELFVMDDGWFGNRNDDKTSLGDWDANLKKLPNGVKGLAEKIKSLGMLFGIWVEPEMVSVDSDLYRSHPEWSLEIPGCNHSEGRTQRILDLTNAQVTDYIIEKLSKLFGEAPIDYVKWDMNRIFSDVFSQTLEKDRQGEVFHRYVLGLYHIMDELTKRFPNILFEGCASGGNRFDLGMLCYFPQIWASDDTDANERMRIQTNYSFGYPLSTMGAHVSGSPNHQTLRETPLDTRFNVAAFGVLGYEINLSDLGKNELDEMRKQILLYKEYRKLFQFGTLYRGGSDVIRQLTVVSENKDEAVSIIVQGLARPNPDDICVKITGLDDDAKYHFYNEAKKHNLLSFGDLVNTVAPIHIKQNSMLHKTVSKFISMDGEVEDEILYGDTLREAGVILKQPYCALGYNDQTRYYPDFGSRMYFVKKCED